MTKFDMILIKSEQFKQWVTQGIAELFFDNGPGGDGKQYWRWTEKGKSYAKYSTLTGVVNFVTGQPLYPIEVDRKTIEPMIRKDWLKDGFNEDGFMLIDSEDY